LLESISEFSCEFLVLFVSQAVNYAVYDTATETFPEYQFVDGNFSCSKKRKRLVNRIIAIKYLKIINTFLGKWKH
jgi:hypothetical protein